MDDVLIMGETEKEHDENVNIVLDKIKSAGMTLNKKKCYFKQKEIEFLGFKVSKESIGAGEKIRGNELFPVPENVKAIKSVLGLINQYARFRKNIAEYIYSMHYSAPIRMLLKKDVPWVWSDCQNKSFLKINEEFRSTSILKHSVWTGKHT